MISTASGYRGPERTGGQQGAGVAEGLLLYLKSPSPIYTRNYWVFSLLTPTHVRSTLLLSSKRSISNC